MKNHSAKAFQPKNLADYQITKIINENTIIVVTTDGRVQKCNIHHIKPITPVEAFISAFKEFKKCIKRDYSNLSTQSSEQKQPLYHLWSSSKHEC